ncbi:MAG: metallophosphoesterase [Ottowia sp.]|nr:metallophosphoesterase [Ottowia sp.]
MSWRLFVVMAVAWMYVALRFGRYLPGGPGLRIAAIIALLLIAQHHQITSRFFGSLASPELPRWLLVALGWAFGSFLLLALLLVLRDVAGGLLFVLSRRAGGIVLGPGAAMGTGVAAAVLGLVGTWQGLKVPAVRTVHVTLPGLPPAFNGYRLVQLSDLHAQRLLPARWQRRVVDRTNGLGADLIVITGDLQDGTPAARAADVAPLADLKARDGVLAVPGNHEYYADYRAWMAAFKRLGLLMLVNRHVRIERDGQAIAVAGLADHQARAFGMPVPDIGAALAGIPAGMPIILLQHQPRSARDNAQAGVALQLSGHAHGGQIWGVSLLARRANNGFLAGLYQVGSMQLYVSRGTGLWNGLILRLGVPSEITELVLRPG